MEWSANGGNPDVGSKLISRRRFLTTAAAAASAIALGANANATARATDRREKPNIVLIVTDDQRADSLACAGNPILLTPHLDALASRGVRFSHSFATTAICMSSRASLLTGMTTGVHGINNFSASLPRKLFEQSYPLLLRQSGYYTGFVGKWGVGSEPLPRDDYDFFQGYGGQGYYFEPGNPRHLTCRQADQAIDFLKGCPTDRPFCLAVSFKAPHVQDEGRNKPGIYAKYPFDLSLKEMYSDCRAASPLADQTALPAFLQQSMNRTREGRDFESGTFQEAIRDLYRLISGVDTAVGQIMTALAEHGFDRNTVVIFTADHGSLYGEHGLGGKWLMYEESIRTPLIICDPRLPSSHGKVCDQMALNIDIAPTLLELASIPIPAGMQGRSLLPMLQSSPQPWRTEWFYENHFTNSPANPIAASEGIRTVDWKYIRYTDTTPLYEQLFDLKTDPAERNNLADQPGYANQLNAMRLRWQTWRTATAAHRFDQPWVEPTA